MSWLWRLDCVPSWPCDEMIGSPSLKVIEYKIPFESFGTVSYSHSNFHSNYGRIFSISEILNIKEWPDLENWDRGCSRSLKMVPFDRTYAIFYWSAIVSRALSCTVFELFDVKNNIVTLKSGLDVTRGHLTGIIRKLWWGFLFAFHSNYGSILYDFWDKVFLRYWSWFFHNPLHSTPLLWGR